MESNQAGTQVPPPDQTSEEAVWVYKPYAHPMAGDNPEFGMSDEAYHEGITFVVRHITMAHDETEKRDKVTVAHVKGLTKRGGSDLVLITQRVDTQAIEGFLNALIIQLGVASTAMRKDEVAKLVPVPLPQYKKLFLPPVVVIAKLGEGAHQLINNPQMVELMEFDEIPTHTLVVYDQYGRNPQDQRFDRETFRQVIMTDYDLDKLDENTDFIQHDTEQMAALSDLPALMAENISPQMAIDEMYGGSLSALLNEPEHGGPGNDTAMDLERMSQGQVGEADIERIAEEDEAMDDEIAQLSLAAKAQALGMSPEFIKQEFGLDVPVNQGFTQPVTPQLVHDHLTACKHPGCDDHHHNHD